MAAVTLFALGPDVRRELPWEVFAASVTVLVVIAVLMTWIHVPDDLPVALTAAALCACLVLAVAWLTGRNLWKAGAHNSGVSHD